MTWNFRRSWQWVAASWLGYAAVSLPGRVWPKPPAKRRPRVIPQIEILEDRVVPTTTTSPLIFNANAGHAGAPPWFSGQSAGLNISLTATGATFDLGPADQVQMEFVGANRASRPVGREPLGDRAFGQVEYANLYPGISLDFRGTAQGQLEADWIVSRGADPSQIKVQFIGADRLALDSKGDLLISSSHGSLIEHAPVLYQMDKGVSQPVSGRYAIQGNQVGFQVGKYNPSLPLVIDPTMGSLYGTGSSLYTTEGNYYSGNLADFHDTDPMATFSANVTWGDGSMTDYSPTIMSDGMGGYYVQDSHTYAEAGSYMVTVNISDSDGNSIWVYSTASVNDAMLSGMGTTFNAAPNQNYNGLVATFTDPGNTSGMVQMDYSTAVTWGDGTGTDYNATIVSNGMGGFNVNDSHTYGMAGTYTVTVNIYDGMNSTTVYSTANVAVPLTGTGANIYTTEGNYYSGNLADFTDTDPMATFSANVSWGDGSMTDYSPTIMSDGMGGYYVQDSHTYAEAGSYMVAVNISDSDGNSIWVYSTANVNDAMLSGMHGQRVSNLIQG